MFGGGNCASVAVIKAAIATYGVNNVFKNVKDNPQLKEYLITLRDGRVISLNYDRTTYGIKKSAFIYTGNSNDEKKNI
jgi:hypothetical protein